MTLALLSPACGPRADEASDVKYDSAVNVALDGAIDNGVVYTDTDQPGGVVAQIREQLRYAIGELNGQGGGVDLAHVAITPGTPAPASGGLFKVPYQATFLVSWPGEYRVPATYPLVLPARGDYNGLQRFVATYGADEGGRKLCLAGDAHGVDTSSFWYYYRPFNNRCALRNASGGQVQRTTLKLKVSAENTSGKSPEYGKIWEDGKLVVTAIFSKYEAGATSTSDAGIAAFAQAYDSLVATFGQPASTTLPARGRPGAQNNDVRLTFNTSRGAGSVDVAMVLVDAVNPNDPAFVEKYEARTPTTDLVVYDGHAGLGANIRALTGLGKYAAGQYQIFMLNGCDTFAYVDDRLKTAHQEVNPGAGPDKYVDIVKNGRPAEFAQMTRATMQMIAGLVGQQKTYRQILAGFDGSQRASVDGEQDNNWPQPF